MRGGGEEGEERELVVRGIGVEECLECVWSGIRAVDEGGRQR